LGVILRILIVGDTHSSWKILYKMIEVEKPDLLVHCGDWGTHVDDRLHFETFIKAVKIPVVCIYGNHDDLAQIKEFKAKNFKWLPSFQFQFVKGINLMGINGNVAGRTRNPWHVTESIIREELRLCTPILKELDMIVSHECPKGYGDLIESRERDKKGWHKWKKNAGWQSLYEVMQKLKPKFWVCGHIHFRQIAQWGNTMIFNPGYGAKGEYILLDTAKSYKPFEWVSVMRNVSLET